MKNSTRLALLLALLITTCPLLLHASEPEAKAESSDKKANPEGKIEAAGSEDAAPTQDPAKLADSVNALPEPPSMDALLAQGGGAPVESVTTDRGALGAGQGSGQGALALGFGLFLVGGGLGAGVVVARQKNRPGFKALPAHHLKHVKSIRLSPKHQISLIEAQGKQLVVGITSAQMTLLATLDDPEAFDALVEAEAPEQPEDATQKWGNLFANALAQRDAQMTPAPVVTKPSRDPESPSTSKASESVAEEVLKSLPPVVKRAEVTLRAEAQAPTEQPEPGAPVVTETPDYTLEEEQVPRHDGMFADHDAEHHAQEPEQDEAPSLVRARARRSRESDSMLIALAAMREEAAR